jgi:heme/copper-type cytochrome/quinol oxidase subunit 1
MSGDYQVRGMIVIYSFTFLFGVIFGPLLAHLRGWTPATIFFAAAAVYGVFGVTSLVKSQIVLSQIPQKEHVFHDAYYIVSHGNYIVSIGIMMAVFGGVTWVQTLYGAMKYPNQTKILFWVFHIAGMGTNLSQGSLSFLLTKPRRYIDYTAFAETYLFINTWSAVISQAALMSLLGLLLWSIMAKWLGR